VYNASMCQLLAMNCNVPTDICFSFTGFRARGGLTDHHKDGWGIAFFEGKGVQQFLDSRSSVSSPIADLVRNYPIKSRNVIAHIRKATQGEVSLENTHPFLRELWGYNWIFAHNGNLPTYQPELNGRFLPIGSTDSERAFCWLLQELEKRFPSLPTREDLFSAIHSLTLSLAKLGEFNYMLSNGEFLLAHCSTRLHVLERKAPFAVAQLKDQDVAVDFSAMTTPSDRVAIVATLPLTDNENWRPIPPGQLWVFSQGEIIRELKTIPGLPPKAE
jgi:predicted glutamine amidotransferase